MRLFRSRTIRALVLVAAVVGLVVVFLQVRQASGRTAATPSVVALDDLLRKAAPDGQAGCAAALYRDDRIA